jgi:hypothetical protein
MVPGHHANSGCRMTALPKTKRPTPEVLERLNELHDLIGLAEGRALIEKATGGAVRIHHDLKPEHYDVVLAAVNQRLAVLPPKAGTCLARLQYEPKCALDQLEPLLKVLNEHGRRLGLYTLAGSFVEAVQSDGSIQFKPLNGAVLAAKLGAHIHIGTTGKNGFKRESCPRDLRDALVTQAHRAAALEIKHVSRTPILRDGKLCSGNGPSGDTWITSPEIPPLPSPCDKAAAHAALDRIGNEWLGEFPFTGELDRATAIAATISMAVRTSLRCPAIAVTKTSHGAGGSTLTNFLSVVLAGERAAMLNGAATGEEMVKQVDAMQRSAGAMLAYDNIPSVAAGFNNEVIAQVVSEESRGVRPFHSNNELVRVENRQAVIFNGVNLRLVDDLTRRTLGLELDPCMERPETRAFKRPELIEEAMARRAQILADCYTILLAYIASGERVRTRPLVGFENWRALVAAALVWLGLPDVVESQEKLKADDPATADLRALAALWLKIFGETEITALQLRNAPLDFNAAGDAAYAKTVAEREALGELLSRIAPEHGPGTTARATKALGNWLRRYRGRVVGNHQLNTTGVAHGGGAKWRWLRINSRSASSTVEIDAAAEAPAEKWVGKHAVVPQPQKAASNGHDKQWVDVPEPAPAAVELHSFDGPESTPQPKPSGNSAAHTPVDLCKTLIVEMGVGVNGKPLGPYTAADLVGGHFTTAAEIANAVPADIMKLGPKYTEAAVNALQQWARTAGRLR